MAFMYCQSCGTKLEYSINPPNFCSSCGAPMGSASSHSMVAEATAAAAPVVQKKISKLEYEINSSPSPGLTIGDVVKQQSTGGIGRGSYKSKTGDPIKDSIDLCRPSRSRDIEEVGD